MSTLIVGCGYLGQRVGTALLRRGERVNGSVRSPERAAEIAAQGIEPLLVDVLRPDTLKAIPEINRVIHCVGFDRSSGADMHTVYVEGLKSLLERLPRSVLRVVYASSTSVYGQLSGVWVDEVSPAEPVGEAGKVCLEAERTLASWREAGLASAVILRFSGLYGPDRVIRRAMLQRGEAIPGDPGRYLNLVHIDDAVQATVAALDAERPEDVYLVSDDRPVERSEYFTVVARLLGAPAPRFEPSSSSRAESAHDEANRRICNRRMRESLGVKLIYPDIHSGVPAALGMPMPAGSQRASM